MKITAANLSKKQLAASAEKFIAFKINMPVMKKLTNTSPFLLLLLPVFMMMVFTLTLNTNQNSNAEMAVKPAKAPAAIIKQATAIFK